MDLRQLRYFKAVAEQGGFSAAAGVLRIAQSALSRQVGLLEAECGGPLFERASRGVALTPAGEVLLQRAAFLLEQVEETRSEVQAENANPRGRVRLGSTPSIGALLFRSVAVRVLARLPRVRLQLIEAITPDPLTSLLNGELDLAVVTRPTLPDGVAFTPLFLERLCLFGLPGASMPDGEDVEAEAMLDVPLIVPSGIPWLPRLRPLLGERIARLRPRIEVVSMTCMTEMVRAGLGLGVVPSWTIRDEVTRGEFRAAHIVGLHVQRGIALPTARPVGRLALHVAEALRADVADRIAAGQLEVPVSGQGG